jgi:hypothetical protein
LTPPCRLPLSRASSRLSFLGSGRNRDPTLTLVGYFSGRSRREPTFRHCECWSGARCAKSEHGPGARPMRRFRPGGRPR